MKTQRGLGKEGKDILFPAANILTLDVDVTPRSQLNTQCNLFYDQGNFFARIGYNIYYRQQESVKQLPSSSLPDNTYAIASRAYAAIANAGAANFLINDATHVDSGILANAIINDSTIDLDAASTSEQITHSISSSFGYIFKDEIKDSSIWNLSAGTKYEFAQQNSAIEHWMIWLKTGLSF